MPLDAARDAVIAMQATVIQALATDNLRLAGQVAGLAARVARLERLASRNSGNSSMPPSADDLPGRTPPGRERSRGRGKRKPGKQPGAPGSHLAWSEHPDDTVPHFPKGRASAARTWAARPISGSRPHTSRSRSRSRRPG
jgi:transposase